MRRDSRQAHGETPIIFGLLGVLSLIFGIVTTILRYHNKGSLSWWEWIVGSVAPFVLLVVGLAMLVFATVAVERIKETIHNKRKADGDGEPPTLESTDSAGSGLHRLLVETSNTVWSQCQATHDLRSL